MAINLSKAVIACKVLPGPVVTAREEWTFVDTTAVSTVSDGVIGAKKVIRTVTPETHTLQQITDYVNNQVDDDQIDILGICTALWST